MKKNSNQGSILILSLWILTLLTLMASSLSFYTMLRVKVLRYRMDQVVGRYLAEAGVHWAMLALATRDLDSYESLSQGWSNSPSMFKEKMVGNGKFSLSYSEIDLDLGLQTYFGIIDEERKINLNTAPKQVLLELPDSTEEIVDAIIDWRDVNPTPERKGAEKDYYQDLDIPYPAKDGPMEDISELLLIKNITPKLLEKWADFVTIYGDGKVNVNTASREVLEMIGLDDSLIEKFMEFRHGPDELPGTEDDGSFKDEGSIARILFEAEPLSSMETSQIINLVSKGLLGVKSKFFRVEATGMPLASLRSGRKVIAIVEHVQGDYVKIRRWLEK
ncbi:MAG: general secretion pathway protein GspK [Chlamydiae bacterium]|nr:general secretion pathway protein GspK [Chlamydiota bacterium]MBI3276731.1 general secretion pathway protein GspK [Chlamydiota bacterium]